MRKSLISLLLVLLAVPAYLTGQTIEEQLLLMREQKIKTYFYQAKSGDRNQKILILDNILGEFDELKYSNKDKKLVELITYLSEEGSTRKEYENNRLVNDFPEVRRKACIILGKLGGDQARDALINILTNDHNPYVKAEALNALSEVKDNQNGDALRAIVYVYRNSYKPDANFVFAIINAVKTIAKDNVTAYADAIYILSEIQMGNYNKKIREAALTAIENLSEG
jgi:HEAT repeat protein